MSTEKLREDYLRWHHLQVETNDIDPMYPVLRIAAEGRGVDPYWACFLHAVWYHTGSTLAALTLWPEKLVPADARLNLLPCGTERRGHRDKDKLQDHVESLKFELGRAGGPRAWVEQHSTGGTPQDRWESLLEGLTSVYGNGRWAAYKTAELLQKVADVDIDAPDAGHRFSSGPRQGLEHLHPGLPTGQKVDQIAKLDALTEFWANELGEPDIARVETSLCDFNSLVKGRYYLGHDIDSMLAQWGDERVGPYVTAADWEARYVAFPEHLLGEHMGWTGVRKQLNRIYKDTGVIVT